jgi:hypothetical protein
MNRSPRQKWSPAKTFAPQTAAAVIERIQVQDLTERELQRLPFGAIQSPSAVLRFNGFESQLSEVSKEQAVGKLFFTEIAPCDLTQSIWLFVRPV